ncbi:MAG TPA: Gfo/Idh/MocA family oxidoreductase [Candidatus Acidoferrales bacterium]|nr:Gfo/Idh/MocA family oxidoreductase [Candidatus Acidoferrales bacterium]
MTTAAAQMRILGANDRVRAGIIGAGGRGRYLIGQFKELGVEVAGVCDVYEPNLQAGLNEASSGARPFRDYRRLLDEKGIDAVIVATPDHWHARMVIDAVEAGKDVYVEKPLAHQIDEGFQIIEAVERARRIVQVGTQRRSAELFLEARKIMQSTQIGEIRLVTSAWYNNQSSLNQRQLAGDLDWKQWLGTAPNRPPDPVRFFNWYWFWDYSGGLLVGQAAHIIDCIQWFMNANQPAAVTCTGNRPELSGTEVPETATITVEYPENYLAVFTLGYRAMRYSAFNDQIKQFHGNKARFDVGRESYALYPESNALEMTPSTQRKSPGSFNFATLSHIRNFLECIASRKQPNAPVEASQATNIVLSMAMQSYRSGRRLRWNAQARRVES